MTTTTTYPNGQVLISSALTVDQINKIIQPLTCGMIGLVSPDYSKVRVEWQTRGQPSQNVQTDVCYINCVPQDGEYTKIRDLQLVQSADNLPLMETWTYTREWRVHWCFYGPTSSDNARLVHSAMFMDYFNEQLNLSNLFPVSEFAMPTRVPEEFNAQWWERADFFCTMYEAVTETIQPGIATSVEVVVQDNVGVRADIIVT